MKILMIIVLALLITITKASPTSRIVGGELTTIESYPWTVSLRNIRGFHFCGGTIIGHSWVITAAHCILGNHQNSVFVRAGTSYMNRGGMTSRSIRFLRHPQFNRQNLLHDVALVETEVNILINGINIAIIPMASHYVYGNSEVLVPGWGFLNATGNPAAQLNVLYTKTISNEECENFELVKNLPESRLCTFAGVGHGICQGDAGASLVENGQLVGVASWKVPCALGTPDGFERISYYRDWILEITTY